MSNEYNEGREARKLGHSIHYNPYRNKGTTDQYERWLAGWYWQEWMENA